MTPDDTAALVERLRELGMPYEIIRMFTTQSQRIATLFDAITHGDEEHRAWLKAAINAHFAGEPVPPPIGTGAKDAKIAALEAALAATTTDEGPTQMQLEAARGLLAERIRDNARAERAEAALARHLNATEDK